MFVVSGGYLNRGYAVREPIALSNAFGSARDHNCLYFSQTRVSPVFSR